MRSPWKVWLLGGVMVVLALFLANCKQNANKAQFDQQKQEVKARLQASIARIDSTIDMLQDAKSRGSDVSGEAKESRNDSLDIRIQALKERKDILQARIDSVEKVSDKEWDAYKNGVDRTVGDVDRDLGTYNRNYYNDTVNVGTGTTTTRTDTMGVKTTTRTKTGTRTGGR